MFYSSPACQLPIATPNRTHSAHFATAQFAVYEDQFSRRYQPHKGISAATIFAKSVKSPVVVGVALFPFKQGKPARRPNRPIALFLLDSSRGLPYPYTAKAHNAPPQSRAVHIHHRWFSPPAKRVFAQFTFSYFHFPVYKFLSKFPYSALAKRRKTSLTIHTAFSVACGGEIPHPLLCRQQ